jgi:hypothetical protein
MNLTINEEAAVQKLRGRAFSLRRVLGSVLMAAYCIAIFLALDFAYSKLILQPEGSARIADPLFHHTLAPNYHGFDRYGELRYRLVTNNLGFKDRAVRVVPTTPDTRRVLVIGDSFTEGIGLPFDDTFVGMLARAGKERADSTDYLNAAVASYSPALYYRKIKYLLDNGYTFDEVVVLPDLSDVQEEATTYFCFDDHPKFRALCGNETYHPYISDRIGARLERSFALTDSLRLLIKFKLMAWTGGAKAEQLAPSARVGWSMANYDPGADCVPLGVEGGIARAVENMQSLAELLAQRKIPLTVAVYPWPVSLVQDDPGKRWAAIWQNFCVTNCRRFINIFPDFVAAKNAHADWYERYYIVGDFHFSEVGHSVVFEALRRNGL